MIVFKYSQHDLFHLRAEERHKDKKRVNHEFCTTQVEVCDIFIVYDNTIYFIQKIQ